MLSSGDLTHSMVSGSGHRPGQEALGDSLGMREARLDRGRNRDAAGDLLSPQGAQEPVWSLQIAPP